mmetsp:Transcript_26770/g.61571  ORF Transcript_26770/g.61571 Transcript_26770/m.61571 type:complete len:108 (-) Transcript_26770:3156-3479(-)
MTTTMNKIWQMTICSHRPKLNLDQLILSPSNRGAQENVVYVMHEPKLQVERHILTLLIFDYSFCIVTGTKLSCSDKAAHRPLASSTFPCSTRQSRHIDQDYLCEDRR